MLTDKQKIAFFLLRNGEKIKTASFASEVHRCTIWRWFKKKDIRRRFIHYCKLDMKLHYRADNLMEIWHKYEADRDALLTAVKGGNRPVIDQTYSDIIREYYEPLEAKIEAKMAHQNRQKSQN